MEIREIIAAKKEAVLDRWFDYILESYPSDTANFMRREKDRFLNPVGHAIRSDIDKLIDRLLSNPRLDDTFEFPENLIKVRAVQDFSPSQAIEFIFQLKAAIREVIEGASDFSSDDLSEIYCRIDSLALAAFDEYMRCRENIFQIRVGEIQKGLVGR